MKFDSSLDSCGRLKRGHLVIPNTLLMSTVDMRCRELLQSGSLQFFPLKLRAKNFIFVSSLPNKHLSGRVRGKKGQGGLKSFLPRSF